MKKEDREFFESIGVDFKVGFGEEYNIFSFEQGILIAEKLETKESIIEFSQMAYTEQYKMSPGLSREHSGNTFGMAIYAAISYLPQIIINKRDKKIDSVIKN